MVAYRNVKPPLGDSIRRLVAGVNSNHTKPPGQQVMDEGDSIVFRSPASPTVVWDGPEVVAWRGRIDESRETLAATEDRLQDAEYRLDQAGERVDEVTAALGDADQRIIDASKTAELARLTLGEGDPSLAVSEKLAASVGLFSELVVTESAILNHTTLLGTTVAEELNVTKQLIGRDAIFNGTVDVAQLNVTGDMSATLVQAMDIETKRLVVTEDAILNRATVIEGIVTSELVAERIVITDLGFDLMQQAALTVTGPQGTVELSGSGYKAWNAQNQLTVDLNGANNLITGQFQTATAGTRVTLSTRLAQGSTDPRFGTSAIDFFVGDEPAHGALWYDSGANRFLNLYALPANGFDGNTATGLTIHNQSDSIQLNGVLANSRAVQKGGVQWTSFAAGQFMTNQTVTFPVPFNDVPYITCQAQTENSTDVLITLRGRSTTGFTYNIVNQGGNSTGALRMDWIAIA